MIGMEQILKLLDQQTSRNSSKILQQGFVIIKGKRMGSYLLKAQLQMHYTGESFCIFLWINNQLLSKFYYLSQIIVFATRGQTLMKIWKTKISVKFLLLLLLLQVSYIFKAFMKALTVLQINIQNQTFLIIFTVLQVWECTG